MDMSILKTIALFVEKFAPTIADVLTGGAASKIGIALEMLASLFGANPQDPNDVLQKIGDAQDADIKLKQLEYDYKARIAETNEKDRESARSLPALGMREFLLGLFIVLVVSVGVVYFESTDPDLRHMCVLAEAGLLLKLLPKIYGLYFGNSDE